MSSNFVQKFLILSLLLSFGLLSESARLPKSTWEQMLPKKFPAHSSAPSKGINSVHSSVSATAQIQAALPSSDGKV
ncbi:hypothetical protein RND81_01G165700 [Saponaria officinalis]|uniref:Uncharacterized protein n=1 Tax=Saponaria officinalis TaxID=3572 RepID=A0AAW1NFF4_SAPOF